MTRLIHGDCLEVLGALPDCSVDAVVTDPPYGLAFMGKKWDYDVPGTEVWAECLRVLKPGGHLLAFAGTRTQHRMCCRIEDAGFEIRDMIAWVYGSGFPKSLDVSKAIDKAAGAEREVTGKTYRSEGAAFAEGASGFAKGEVLLRDKPATPAAQQWSGWGTALKPALEPVTVARKPLGGTVAENVLAHGTGALNVDGCRVPISADDAASIEAQVAGFNRTQSIGGNGKYGGGEVIDRSDYSASSGRWPANLIHDGSDEVVGLFPSNVKGGTWNRTAGARHFNNDGDPTDYQTSGSDSTTGSAARFFYCAKASKADRDEGCEGLEARQYSHDGRGTPIENAYQRNDSKARNHHPTVKPTDLMRYLCRLVTPPGGTVLDPFMGSGSTGKACVLEGFGFIGIEREAEYVEIARARIAAVEGVRQTALAV